MKKFAFILITVLGLTACSNGPLTSERLIGTWRVTDFTTTCKLSPTLIGYAKEFALTCVYEFSEDGTFIYSDSVEPNPLTGIWDLTNEGKTLHAIFDDDGHAIKMFTVISSSDDALKMTEEEGDMGTNTYTLVKGHVKIASLTN